MAFQWARANPVGSLRCCARIIELLGLAGVAFLSHLAHAVLPSVAVLYASYRYGWSDQVMGLTLAAAGMGSGIVQGFLIRPAIRGSANEPHSLVGLLFGTADLPSTAWQKPARGSGRHSADGIVGSGEPQP